MINCHNDVKALHTTVESMHAQATPALGEIAAIAQLAMAALASTQTPSSETLTLALQAIAQRADDAHNELDLLAERVACVKRG